MSVAFTMPGIAFFSVNTVELPYSGENTGADVNQAGRVIKIRKN